MTRNRATRIATLLIAISGCSSKREGTSRQATDALPLPIDAGGRIDAVLPRGNLASLTVDMIRIPEGHFYSGCDPATGTCGEWEFGVRRSATPVHEFYIDRTEVTVAAYASCVRAGRCSAPRVGQETGSTEDCTEEGLNWGHDDRDDHPINCITPHMAVRYCEFRNKRLPSDREWMRAARGDEPRLYPWGDDPVTCERAVIRDPKHGCEGKTTAPVGSKPGGASQFGVLDLLGNVGELVAKRAEDVEQAKRLPDDPLAMSCRGGAFDDESTGVNAGYLRLSSNRFRPAGGDPAGGFRCALDLDGQPW